MKHRLRPTLGLSIPLNCPDLAGCFCPPGTACTVSPDWLRAASPQEPRT